ncbi:hypothetical protein AKJ09_07744 [Labilithrix luteola]|uniref:Uncharacterized protein n=1 Tax=Labilithrix luteola TaxID=1391654 RepID=A0A0K1Q5H4_9BACT|nr:hypothetical protein [Labilithrix luteola]AKV01081.1 hypothetical protein AKJ09_07744 [Labilithrix luteola]
MDPYAPINGISLERYAELCADVSETQDPDRQAEIVAQKGVTRTDWEAAKAGWTARMQDMSLMGQVATRYMPLYQAALGKKNPAPRVGFEDYVAMSGCVPVIGYEGMLAHYRITQAHWTQIASQWNAVIPTNPQYAQFGMLVQQEAARIRAGGAPRPVNFGAPAPAQAAPNPYGYTQPAAPGAYPAPNAWPAHQQPYNGAQASNIGAQFGSAIAAFGSAFGSLVNSAVGAYSIGAPVMVQWSDGNRYPGTIAQVHAGQLQIGFPDGRLVWVPEQYVTLR